MNTILKFFLTLLLLGAGSHLHSQSNITVLTGQIDGVDITKQNILSYQILSGLNYPIQADVHGTLYYRQSNYRIQYQYSIKLNPGINTIDPNVISIQWNFSTPSLNELFNLYNILPAGTYQYCIKVLPKNVVGEHELGASTEECLYHKNEEIFAINLITPENDSKLYEKNPTLSWVASYSMTSELNYKIRVAEIKKGQSTQSAIARNNPVYTESKLFQNTIIYPLAAKPLIVNQPYAWTVDAYYKDLLLGGAEPWKFTLVEDTLKEEIPKVLSYLDIEKEEGKNMTYAVGALKLKYFLREYKTDTLLLKLYHGEDEVNVKNNQLFATKGENKYDIDFMGATKLKHGKDYKMIITPKFGTSRIVNFKFINPNY